MTTRKSVLLLCIALLIILSGCGKKESTPQADNSQASSQGQQGATPQTPPPATPPAETPSSGAPAAAGSAPATQATAPPKPAMPEAIVVPAKTGITVRVDNAISTKDAQPGQAFTATLAEPIAVDGRTLIPAGAHARGVVVDSKSAGKMKGDAVLVLQLKSIDVRGKSYPIATNNVQQTLQGRGKHTAKVTGGTAAGGAVIGGIAGGGKGAAIGGLVGAGTGAVVSAKTGQREVTIGPETAVAFRLAQPLKVQQATTSATE